MQLDFPCGCLTKDVFLDLFLSRPTPLSQEASVSLQESGHGCGFEIKNIP